MIGQTISHYKILEKLGEGGMGVVYKALDTKLEREVALKFLPAHLAASEGDKARFIQEARAASALNHPNVCTIHDIQEHDGQMFIVLEFVDGQTLREKKNSINFKQAIDIGIQIADGLAAAHEKGIVHRDIKPENIMIRKDGIAQIMDFGLAKLRASGSKITRLTKEGSTVGTAGYMSPEQVQGQDTDHRSDIFSYGVLLYELLTGQLPFKGVHETALAYEIVNVDPAPMSSIKPDIDPNLDSIILECLEKDPRERTQSIAQTGLDLKRYRRESSRQKMSRITAARPAFSSQTVEGSTENQSMKGSTGKPGWLPWTVASISLVLAVGVLFMYFRTSNREIPLFTAAIQPPDGTEYLLSDGGHMALSPDGTTLVFVAADTSGKTSLWVRKLDSNTPTRLLETEGAEYPFWSYDSRSIGFFIPGKMKKVMATGGPPFVICDAPSGRGGSWNSDDIIIFAPKFDRTGIDRVSAGGGAVTHITSVDSSRNMSNARWPHFLPDGKHFIYTTQAAKRTSEFSGELYVASLDGSVDKHLVNLSTNVEYRNGKLLYVRQDALVMQDFDTGTLELSGDVVPLVNKIGYAPNRSKGVFSSSLDGVLLYLTVASQGRTLSWISRQENTLAPVGDVVIDNSAFLSRDNTRIIYDGYDAVAKNFDIWMYDITRGVKSRMTFDPSDDSNPVLSPDGKRFVYTSWKEGVNIYIKKTAGTDKPEFLQKSITSANPTDWSTDGRHILFQDVELTADWDVWYRLVEGDSVTKPLIKTEFTEENSMFSPDGRWVSYNSDESSRNEVYVTPFPSADGKIQVSTGGGRNAIWDRNGTAIYYISDQGVVATQISAAKGIFSVGESKLMFRNPSQAGLRLHGITSDGKKILVSHLATTRNSVPLTVVTDWRKTVEMK